MKHSTSRQLHAYWDRLRGGRAAPERAEIEPGQIRHVLADCLILEIDPQSRATRLRLAGTRICALFGREVTGEPLAALWGGPSPEPGRLVDAVALDTDAVVAGLCGTTARDETVDLELLLMPLRHRGRTRSRALGSLGSLTVPHWIGLRPIVRLDTTSLRVLSRQGARAREDGEGAPPVRRGHLLVHPGGLG